MKSRLYAILGLLAIITVSACGGERVSTEGSSEAVSTGQGSSGKGAATGGDRQNAERNRMQRFRNRPVPVAVAWVQRGRVDAYYASTTSLTAREEAVVVARTQGVVEEIFVEEGDMVTAETPLAQLDTDKLELEVARTKTNLLSLERAFDRAKQLMDSKMISPDAYDKARFDFEREQATLALQLHDLKEATIRAPIAGVITIRHIKLGNTLSPNNPTFEIKKTDRLEAILNVPEKELVKLKVRQSALVRIDALNGQEFAGLVDRIAPEIDATSGTFRVTVSLDNPDGTLKPGMFARVNIRFDSNEDTLLVAREAVVTQRDESTVFVVRDGLALRQPVVTGYTMGEEVEILEGLGEGDQVIITGQGGLRDGASVKVVSL